MARDERFTFTCNREERQMLAALAERLRRSQSDAMRMLLREAVVQLETAVSPQQLQSDESGENQ